MTSDPLSAKQQQPHNFEIPFASYHMSEDLSVVLHALLPRRPAVCSVCFMQPLICRKPLCHNNNPQSNTLATHQHPLVNQRPLQVANKRELPIRAVKQRRIPVDEAFAAKEIMCIGSAMGVVGIHHWDEVAIGDGKPGAVANALYQLLLADMDPERGDPQMHTAVPYGYLTGMKDQLV